MVYNIQVHMLFYALCLIENVSKYTNKNFKIMIYTVTLQDILTTTTPIILPSIKGDATITQQY